jgi:hypothetical protein
MPIAKDKSVKPSTRRRAGVRVVPRISPKRARPVSTQQVAEQFCAEMLPCPTEKVRRVPAGLRLKPGDSASCPQDRR